MIDSFGLRVRQAMNQVVLGTRDGRCAAGGRGSGPRGLAGSGRHHCRRRYGSGDLHGRTPRRRSGRPVKDDVGRMTKTVQTAIVGVTGYAGAELARLLLHHPRLDGKPPVFAGRVEGKDLARGGIPLAEIHPQLADHNGSSDLKLEPFSWELLSARGVDVLFLATPHEQSREWAAGGAQARNARDRFERSLAADRCGQSRRVCLRGRGLRDGRGHAGAGGLRHARAAIASRLPAHA